MSFLAGLRFTFAFNTIETSWAGQAIFLARIRVVLACWAFSFFNATLWTVRSDGTDGASSTSRSRRDSASAAIVTRCALACAS